MILLGVVTAMMFSVVRGPERAALHEAQRVHVARAVLHEAPRAHVARALLHEAPRAHVARALLHEAPRAHVARAFQARDDVAEHGKQLYLKYGCYQCHGRQGQGSSAGPRLAPAPMGQAAFARYVRQPRGEMPPYTAKVVTDQELADIHAFLRSVPRPPAVAALPFDR